MDHRAEAERHLSYATELLRVAEENEQNLSWEIRKMSLATAQVHATIAVAHAGLV